MTTCWTTTSLWCVDCIDCEPLRYHLSSQLQPPNDLLGNPWSFTKRMGFQIVFYHLPHPYSLQWPSHDSLDQPNRNHIFIIISTPLQPRSQINPRHTHHPQNSLYLKSGWQFCLVARTTTWLMSALVRFLHYAYPSKMYSVFYLVCTYMFLHFHHVIVD
jgi:hypothetical protein